MGSSVIVELLPAVHDAQQKKICYPKMKLKIKITTHCVIATLLYNSGVYFCAFYTRKLYFYIVQKKAAKTKVFPCFE
jgi:hypothetical protein